MISTVSLFMAMRRLPVDTRFDFDILEYGAWLCADPHRWLPRSGVATDNSARAAKHMGPKHLPAVPFHFPMVIDFLRNGQKLGECGNVCVFWLS
jgi:hypothetical protein